MFLASTSSGKNIQTGVDSPGYVRWDAFAAYHMKLGDARLTAQLNINNILDKKYFSSTQLFGGPALFPAAPRTFLGSLRVEY